MSQKISLPKTLKTSPSLSKMFNNQHHDETIGDTTKVKIQKRFVFQNP